MRGTEMTWMSQVFHKGGAVGVVWSPRSVADVVHRGTVLPDCPLMADTSGSAFEQQSGLLCSRLKLGSCPARNLL